MAIIINQNTKRDDIKNIKNSQENSLEQKYSSKNAFQTPNLSSHVYFKLKYEGN